MTCLRLLRLSLLFSLLFLVSCANREPLETVNYVDMNRFMGDWFVIANIPTPFEKDAYNPIESYQLNPDGTVATTFTFNKGSFDGEQKVMTAVGFIKNKQTNAEWGMQFIWPIKADYRIVYLDQKYQYTVIGRNKRDYLWIMARQSQIPDEVYSELQALLLGMGYDTELIQRAPHQAMQQPVK
jgi:apolipoprotein D and lipocalin family protein